MRVHPLPIGLGGVGPCNRPASRLAFRSRSCFGMIALAAMVATGCSSDPTGPVDRGPVDAPGPLPPSGDPSSPSPPSQSSARILISDGYDPAWSPDGTRIAFASTRDGEPAIYLANADGSAARRLTSGSWPAWSPDGRRIAFHREGDFAWGDGQILIIETDGSNETTLSRGEFPAWSPDGARIAFADGEGIAVMNADGSGISRLLGGDFLPVTPSIPNGIGKPAWSPDGRWIAFEHVGDSDMTPAQIYVMNSDGSLPRRLTPTRGIQYAESDPAWSPAGSRIAFWSYGYGIATVAANGGAQRTVYKEFPPVVYGAKPAWSPDGITIAFTARYREGGVAIWVVGGGE